MSDCMNNNFDNILFLTLIRIPQPSLLSKTTVYDLGADYSPCMTPWIVYRDGW